MHDALNRQQVLVTGAGGFIGHHLLAQLANDGVSVRGVDRLIGVNAVANLMAGSPAKKEPAYAVD